MQIIKGLEVFLPSCDLTMMMLKTAFVMPLNAETVF